MSASVIRHAQREDLPVLTDIYNYYVRETPITFDITPFTPEAREPWFNQYAPGTRHQLLVLLEGDIIQGYAGSAQVRPKPAYETSVECTVYLRPEATGRGLGKQLYTALFKAIDAQDIHRCYGIITLPNEPSVKLHRDFGFVDAGHLKEVGRKFGRYWDTLWMERSL